MTITTPLHHDVCKDEQVDRRVDVQTDGRKAAGKDSGGLPPAGAFVVVLANHKGGVTKTTSTANLGATLAEAGRRVLIVDCDPQANLSEAFGWVEELPGERLEDLLANPDAAGRYTPPTALQPDLAPGLEWRERLRIIPSTDALADIAADLPVAGGAGYEMRLREVLEPLREQFDLVLLDTPPGLGTLSGMAVLAADGLLIPALAADLDVRGAGKLYDLVEGEIPGLRILGVLLAASERRWRVTRDATDRMTADEMRVSPCRSRGLCGSPRRRAIARRPWCSSRTRWSATPTGNSLITSSRSSGDERSATDAVRAAAADPRHGQPTDHSTVAGAAPADHHVDDGAPASEAAASTAARPSPVSWAHCEACAWTATWLTARGRGMVGPREMLARTDWRGELRWRERGELRRRGHRPDLGGRLPDGQLLPIEVELTEKSSARLKAVLALHSEWLSAGKSGGVIYVCGDEEIAERVLADGAHAGLSVDRGTIRIELIAMIQREAVEACSTLASTEWHVAGSRAA